MGQQRPRGQNTVNGKQRRRGRRHGRRRGRRPGRQKTSVAVLETLLGSVIAEGKVRKHHGGRHDICQGTVEGGCRGRCGLRMGQSGRSGLHGHGQVEGRSGRHGCFGTVSVQGVQGGMEPSWLLLSILAAAAAATAAAAAG